MEKVYTHDEDLDIYRYRLHIHPWFYKSRQGLDYKELLFRAQKFTHYSKFPIVFSQLHYHFAASFEKG